MNTDSRNRHYAAQDTNIEVDGEEAEADTAANEQATGLKKLAERVDAFVEGEGDLVGAMFEE
jgi:hypothetical protein